MNNEDWASLARDLEGAAGLGHVDAVEGPAMISIAVSLKRIADALETQANIAATAAAYAPATHDLRGESMAD